MGRKATTITLSTEDREFLELQTRALTIQVQTVNRARILLLKADGVSIDKIADKVGINRKSVMLCIKKFSEGGVENALYDAPGRGRNAEEAGHTRLSTVSRSKVRTILEEADIKPNRIT